MVKLSLLISMGFSSCLMISNGADVANIPEGKLLEYMSPLRDSKLSLHIVGSTFTQFTKDFLKKHPSENFLKVTDRTDYYDIILSGKRLKVEGYAKLKNGDTVPQTKSVYDGHRTTEFSVRSSGTSVYLENGLKRSPSGGLELGPMAFLPFSFLSESKDPMVLPVITLADLTDSDLIKKVLARMTLAPKIAGFSYQPFKLASPDGQFYLVGFDENGFPKELDKYGQTGKISQSLRIKSLADVNIQGKKIPFVREGTLRVFLEGWEIYDFWFKIDKVEVLEGPLPDSTFEVDISKADNIIDIDAGIQMEVPRH